MKVFLMTLLIFLFSVSTVFATTVTLKNVTSGENLIVLSFEIMNGTYTHSIDIRIPETDLINISTWSAFWTYLQPKLSDIVTKYQNLDTKMDLLKSKIDQPINF